MGCTSSSDNRIRTVEPLKNDINKGYSNRRNCPIHGQPYIEGRKGDEELLCDKCLHDKSPKRNSAFNA